MFRSSQFQGSPQESCMLSDDTTIQKAVPRITFEENQLLEARRAHALTLIGQFSLFRDKRLPLKVLEQRLPTLQSLQETLEILELQNSFFLASFSQERDLKQVRQGTPWTLVGQQQIQTNWVPNFDPLKVS
ncbi:hypothetical protein AAC387_Pa05g1406 [Persea americana]